MKLIRIYLGNDKQEKRIVEAELLKRSDTTVKVRLPDGNIIIRKIKKDVVDGL